MKKLILLIPIIFLLTGCYNYRELNDLAIVSGVSVNYLDEEYEVVGSVVNPKKQQDASSSNEPDFVIYKKKDKSLQEAFRKLVLESPKKLYGAQIEILIIDEDLAKERLKDILDFFARDPEIRSEFMVLVGRKNDVLGITTPLDNLSSKNIIDSLESSANYLGYSNLVTYHDLIANYLNPYIELALPSLEVTGNIKVGEHMENLEETVSDANILISSISVFKDNKLLGYLNEDESLAYNLVTNNTKTWLFKTEYDSDKYVVSEIIDNKVSVSADVSKKKIDITVKGNAAIAEVNGINNLESKKVVKSLSKRLNKEVEKFLVKNINSVIDNYNSDIYGFGDLFYKTDSKEFKKIKNKWYDEIFSNLKINVKSEIKIIEKGNLNGGIYNE